MKEFGLVSSLLKQRKYLIRPIIKMARNVTGWLVAQKRIGHGTMEAKIKKGLLKDFAILVRCYNSIKAF